MAAVCTMRRSPCTIYAESMHHCLRSTCTFSAAYSQMAQTINFLTENNITDYDTLVEKTKAATERYHELSQQIKQIEKRMAEITELKKHIINYAKTKDVFTAYRQSGYSTKYYESNTENILLHQSAKQGFDSISSIKIPSMRDLQDEFNTCLDSKKEIGRASCRERV